VNILLSYKKCPLKFWYILLFLFLTVLTSKRTIAIEFPIHHNPQSYVLTKFQSQDIVFLGTHHRQPPILNFVSDLITALHNSGVTHIGLEIASDQKAKIDPFIKTGTGLSDIAIHPQIDSPKYRNLFNVVRGLDPQQIPVLVALDLPKSKYADNIGRDEWMAGSISGVFETNPGAKMLVVVGNNHILKKLDWQDSVINKHESIREYLLKKRGGLRIFLIGQVIGDSVYEDDFCREFGLFDGAVAVDLDKRFAGWKLAIVQSMSIKHAEVWELLDGLVVY